MLRNGEGGDPRHARPQTIGLVSRCCHHAPVAGEPTTRAAERRDVDGVARLAHGAYQHYVARLGRAPAPMEADYATLVNDGTVWVAEDGDQLLGFIVLIDAGDHLLLDNVAVDPDAQGRGIGAQLLTLAEDAARRRDYSRITLHTNEAMTENLEFYPRLGYVETHRGEQDGYRRVFFSKTLGGHPDE
jgi:GNAT superfamily N-acetyltransferase